MFIYQIIIKGFNEKQYILLSSIIRKLISFEVDDKKFVVYTEQVRVFVILTFELYNIIQFLILAVKKLKKFSIGGTLQASPILHGVLVC